jgi:hypothetical protein
MNPEIDDFDRLDQGDQFEIRERADGSDYERVHQLTVTDADPHGQMNGFLQAEEDDETVWRFYVDSDGRVTMNCVRWGPSDEWVVRAVAFEHGLLYAPEYTLVETTVGDDINNVELREKNQAATAGME